MIRARKRMVEAAPIGAAAAAASAIAAPYRVVPLPLPGRRERRTKLALRCLGVPLNEGVSEPPRNAGLPSYPDPP